MASALDFYKSYTIKRALAQVAGTAIAATGAATNKLSATAHGLVDGDVIVVSTHATLTLTNLQRYYVRDATANDFKVAATKAGSAIAIGDSGSASVIPIVQIELDWANKIASAGEKDTYEWNGSDQSTRIELLKRQSLTIDLSCIPAEAHSLIFDKSAISETTLVNGMTVSTAVGYGGGADKSGANVGIVLEGYALKGATETVVTFSQWYPRGILALSSVPGLSTGAIGDNFQYIFNATKGALDIAGGTIAGLSSDGEFVIVAESL